MEHVSKYERLYGLNATAIFYSGIVAGCSAADDPTPLETPQEYCELGFTIDRGTASTAV